MAQVEIAYGESTDPAQFQHLMDAAFPHTKCKVDFRWRTVYELFIDTTLIAACTVQNALDAEGCLVRMMANFAVAAKYRRLGYGTFLLKRVRAYEKKLMWETPDETWTRSFYEGAGATALGRKGPWMTYAFL